MISWRIRSRPRNPACPSFEWNIWACSSERVEGPHAADAEQDLLAETVLRAPAVEAVGDFAQFVGVLVDVGVEQVQLDAPDAAPPRSGR